MLASRGSTWSKWDLHVHTPASLDQYYGGDEEKVWDRFLSELEALPSEFKVLGINDYLFVDGYRRVLKAREQGRLKNIELLLPVIELRLNKFGGSESTLRRINYHIIFSDEVHPDTIEYNFIYALSRSFTLTPGYEHLAKIWHSNLTRGSVEELGKMIHDATPESKRIGNFSFLQRGFANLNFELDDILDKLRYHHFEGKYLTAVGKTEWADVKWNYQIAAEKKDVINSVDLVFTSFETPENWRKAKNSLQESGVNNRLLDCSDAHSFSDAVHKDRLGNCYTWIKAAPTFNGLKHALRESEERIFVGEEPEKVRLVRENKTKYVKSLRISKVPDSQLNEVWFDNEFEFNTDLVAIIGNKGSGKSALLDVLGLSGETRQHRAFSFLHTRKFRQLKDNKAQHFEATLTWESGKIVTKNLDLPVSGDAVETIKYIPQSFLEQITNEIASGEGEHFRQELEAVIFSHVEEADRLGKSSLDELIQHKTQETYEAIDSLTEELRTLNAEIVRLERHSADEHRRELEKRLASREEELIAHEQVRPPEVSEPKSDPKTLQRTATVVEDLERFKIEHDILLALIAREQERKIELARLISAVDKASLKAENIEHRYSTMESELMERLQELGIDVSEVVQLRIELSPLTSRRQLYVMLQGETVDSLDPSNPQSYRAELEAVEEEITSLQARLDEPSKEYESYLSALKAWSAKRQQILGTEETVGSLKHLKKLLKDLDEVPTRLQEARRRRREKAREIHREIRKLAETYRALYKPVQEFIEGHRLARGKFDLNFEVSIVEEGFENRLFAQINRVRSGSFCGVSESSTLLNDILEQHDFQDESSTLKFLDRIMEHLYYDARMEPKRPVKVSEQLKQGYTAESLYDFVYSLEYLKPRYTLRMGEKELHELSPGERGTLLLIFYLLVDKDDVPLVIDQPEENLDNQTIYDLLVPCIREAKKRRQLFLVTHNPNLAVAGDAEQIIRAEIDKKGGNRINYVSGPLEDIIINHMAVDVLEGTRPAFENRSSKYLTGLTR